MKKQMYTTALAMMASLQAFAGGFLTNTNQNAAFGRNFSQEAMIDVLATYANPAGVAFLTPGWHFALSNQSAIQTRTIDSWFVDPQQGAFLMGTANGQRNTSSIKRFEGKSKAAVIPSFDIAYVQDRWSLGFHFGVVGGGGKCEFSDGLGSFESKVAMLPSVVNAFVGNNDVKGYSLDTYMRGRQYFFGGQLNGTYKVTPNLSVALGLRAVHATNNYYGYVSNMSAVLADGTTMSVHDYLQPALTQLATAIPQAAPLMTEVSKIVGDVRLNCDQTGWGLTPIIGIDWRINDHWNVAAKYEFKTRLRLRNESGESASGSVLAQLEEWEDGKRVEADIPAILTAGVQYSPIQTVRVNLGGHLYFDKQATQYNHREELLDGQSWEILTGAEYDLKDWLTISAGWQHTHYGLGDNSKYITDMSFVTSSNSVGLGARFHVSKNVALDVSYFKTFYQHYDRYQEDYNDIKSNFGSLLSGIQQNVGLIAQGIAAEDVSAGVNPAEDPRIQIIQGLDNRVNALTTASTPGNDRFCRTNDVIGLGIVVNF
ncbi:MAG: outer membrane protein transport protein [Bacteroidaceae bacterium]|nr:outer membrane protein transport protein [Bacteroidaceae bacterium]